VLGAKVANSAPISSGTVIMPPGTFSIARLIGICMVYFLPASCASLIILRNFPQEPLRTPPNMRKLRIHQTLFAQIAQFLKIS
jgi:hypothetical protein